MRGSTQYHLRPVQINSSVKKLHGECDRTLEVYIEIPPLSPIGNFEDSGSLIGPYTLFGTGDVQSLALLAINF